MRKSISIGLLATAAAAIALGGCNKAMTNTGAVDTNMVKQAIKADEAKQNRDFKAKDTEALAERYADDAFFVAPGVTANGSTAIRQVFANASTDPAFSVQFSSDKVGVSASGDMAYARGKFTEKYTDKKSGKVMTGSGSYLTVYQKQSDGNWKIVEDVAAADPGSIKPVPPEKPATRAKMVSF